MSGLQGALKFWNEFNIGEFQVSKWFVRHFTRFTHCFLQRELDNEGQAVAKRQDESDAARRRLVELSREFKKTSSEVIKALDHYLCMLKNEKE